MSEDHPDDNVSAPDDESWKEVRERILGETADPICAFDETGQFRYGNRTLERQTGYSADEIRGQPLTLVMSNDDAQALLGATEELQEDTTTVELSLELDDGSTKSVECSLSLVEPDSTMAVAVMRDITEERERERRLSKFARVVSHDLRNPLDVALGRAEMLPEIAGVDDETEQHLHEIHNALTRMEHLIEDVLQVSRQETDDIERETVSLATVVTEAWRTVETRDATLTVTTDAVVSADPARLRRALENLFRNAVEHGGGTDSDGSVSVEVGLVEDDTGDGVGFYVADDGPGIDAADRERLFEGGYTTANSGTGLGLTIVREIVHSHGWSVALGDSEERSHLGGARFEITGVTVSAEPDGET